MSEKQDLLTSAGSGRQSQSLLLVGQALSGIDLLICNLYTLLYRLETAMKKAPKARDSRVSSSAPSNEPENHEETLNFSNLTEFRNSLLQVIPKLQEDDLLRFVITKHGQPAAVIMSYQAYSTFKRIA